MSSKSNRARALTEAVNTIRSRGMAVVDVNPASLIDFVVYNPENDSISFVRAIASESVCRYRCPRMFHSREKRMLFKRQCSSWRRQNSWQGDSRFDFVMVYLDGECCRGVDYIENAILK